MKTEQFIQRLSPLPAVASDNEVTTLELFTKQYPWCGIAQQLLLEALYQSDDSRFTDYIPKTATYVVYREQLRCRLRQLEVQSIAQIEETVSLTTEDDTILEIEEEGLKVEEGTPEIVEENLKVVKETQEIEEDTPKVEEESLKVEEDTPEIVEENLKVEEKTPQVEPRPVVKTKFIFSSSDYFAGEVVEVEDEKDPIVRFIIDRPQIRPIAGALSGIALPSQIEQMPPPKNFEDIVSETLAKIYEDQGLVSLAQATYEKLRLLEPKKNAYFAARIQNLKFKLKS